MHRKNFENNEVYHLKKRHCKRYSSPDNFFCDNMDNAWGDIKKTGSFLLILSSDLTLTPLFWMFAIKSAATV